jgi:hypothetical protein
MRWIVSYTDMALDQLTTIWLNAPDRAAVTRASDELERELRNDADVKGRPFFGGRTISHDPLVFFYEVIPDDCLVRVTEVVRRKP